MAQQDEQPNEDQPAENLGGELWDGYIQKWPEQTSKELEWPGDEWGTEEGWRLTFETLFVPAGVNDWKKAVEIGQGSGKYTLMVLDNAPAVVRAYDVSSKFLEICKERCRDQVDQGRLSLHLLDSVQPDQMLLDLTSAGWRRQVDGFYSIAAMVHVELQELIVYLLTAALVLKPSGKLILTLADVTRPGGVKRLLEHIPKHYRQVRAGRFKWLGPDIIHSVLEGVGFDVETFELRPAQVLICASMNRPAVADELEQYLVSEPATVKHAGPRRAAPGLAETI
jgi:SAM-dependent methyltransferase